MGDGDLELAGLGTGAPPAELAVRRADAVAVVVDQPRLALVAQERPAVALEGDLLFVAERLDRRVAADAEAPPRPDQPGDVLQGGMGLRLGHAAEPSDPRAVRFVRLRSRLE